LNFVIEKKFLGFFDDAFEKFPVPQQFRRPIIHEFGSVFFILPFFGLSSDIDAFWLFIPGHF